MNKIMLFALILGAAIIATEGCKNSKKAAKADEKKGAQTVEVKPTSEQPKETTNTAIERPKHLGEDPAQPQKAADEAPVTAAAVDEPQSTIEPPKYPDSLYFRMERTPCFGQCPIFTVNIYSSGWAHLEGKRFFDYIGEFSTRFSEEELVAIESLAMKYGYTKFEHVYDAPVTDLPSTTTIIQSENMEHWVYNRMNSPRELRNFELEIETIIKDKQWKPYSKK